MDSAALLQFIQQTKILVATGTLHVDSPEAQMVGAIQQLTDMSADQVKRIAELEAQNAALLEFVRKTAELNSRESFNINWYGTRARALLAELGAKEGDE
jgi:hypothetical protein